MIIQTKSKKSRKIYNEMNMQKCRYADSLKFTWKIQNPRRLLRSGFFKAEINKIFIVNAYIL